MLHGILDKMFWWVLGIFAIPTTLILVSWNSVPGNYSYGIKIGLEQLALNMVISPKLKSALQIKYTQRRFDEVQKVLPTDQASESLDNLNRQIIAAQITLDNIKSPQDKTIQTQNLISTLETVSQKIEQEKETINPPTLTNIKNSKNNSVIVNSNQNNIVQVPTQNVPIPTSNPDSISFPTNIPTEIILPAPTVIVYHQPERINPSTPTPVTIAAAIRPAQTVLVPLNTPKPSPTPTAAPTQVPPTQTPTREPTRASNQVFVPPPPAATVSDQLDETQKKIKEVIDELKKSQDENVQLDVNPESHNSENKNKDKEKDKNKDKNHDTQNDN